ncbi:uncharacterized protein A1O5_02912 [Cladophialophora psammophila CBS 110553]|uniref:Uncharacterized protein n=1 Tax=Cladophialophora psammophila CBS 110553 TaxID=1182543 RepID=W9XBB0_9EURO|nr:uncharacterized protein A1O5_02912 [Cladophialophora psammophila CBS 110553]EXJ74615.1 hypothetical protein A1O5_02912 [Cladophialophora psammophila CBS 110553]
MLQSEPQTDIVFTITYEYIEGRHIQDFYAVTPYWLDVGGCKTSDVPAYRDSIFNYSSPILKGVPQGMITFVGGHLHDGGTHIDLTKNGRVVCRLNALYDRYRYQDDGKLMEHVSIIETCETPAKTVTKDEWSIVACYNTSLHEPMEMMDGSLEPVMGIMLVYVAQGLERHGMSRTMSLSVILGIGSLAAVALLAAAWCWLEGRCGHRNKRLSFADMMWTRDRDLEQEAVVPLMKT